MVLRKTDLHPGTKKFVEEFIRVSDRNKHLHDQIADYVAGDTDECPPIVEDPRFYTYSLRSDFEKLRKRGEEQAFYRAAVLIYKASNRFYEKKNVMDECFLDQIELRSMNDNGDADIREKDQKAFEAMKKTVEHFGHALFAEFLSKAAEDYHTSISRDYSSAFDRAKFLLFISYAYSISPSLLEAAKVKLVPSYYYLLTGDTREFIKELHSIAKEVVTMQYSSNNLLTNESLYPSFVKEKKAALREKYYPGEQPKEGSLLNQKHLKRYMELVISLLYYRIHVKGGINAFLNKEEEIDRELHDTLQILFDMFPLDILSEDKRLAGLVHMDEPYDLLLGLREHLLSPPTQWEKVKQLVLEDLTKSRRALELASIPMVKGYLYKTLAENGEDLSGFQPSLEGIVQDALRRAKGSTKLASYLDEKAALEDVLEHVNLEDTQLVRQQMILLSFLPVDHPFIARLIPFMCRYNDKSNRRVGHMCFAYAFQDRLAAIIEHYQTDEDVDIQALFYRILTLKEMHYYYTEVNEEVYRSLVVSNPAMSLAQFDKLETDIRVFVLQTLLAAKDTLTVELRNEAILLGLSDSSKKVSGIAGAAFLQAKDKELYLHVYRTEKKAKVKELALDAIRSLDNNKDIFQELLAAEKNNKFKTLLQTFIEAEEHGPDASLTHLGNLIDKRKLTRIKWMPLERIPHLRDQEGNELGQEVMEYILTASIEFPTAPNPLVLDLKPSLQAASMADFSAEVLRTWLDNGAVAKEKWVMPICVAFGDRRIVDTIGQWIKDWTDHSRGALAADGVRALSFSDDLTALRLIDQIKRTIKNRQVKTAAEEALAMAAANQNISAMELEDRLVTTLGFDASGKQVFDYGDRTFTVKVSNELELEVTNDSTGKAVKNLPAPSAKDDQEMAEQARLTFAQLKKDLKNMVKIQSLRLEESLSKSRYWSTAAWKRLFVENVLMQKFAIGLIWGVYEDSKLVDTFRYMDDGTFNTVDEDEYELADEQLIGLIHPLELDEETLSGWRTQLEDYEIAQPFEQLNREAFLPTEEELKANEVLRLPDESYSPTAFAKTMEKFGWVKGTPLDAGYYYEFYKLYDGMVAELKISGASITYWEGMEDVKLEALAFFPNEDAQYKHFYFKPVDRLKLTDIPTRIFSETVYDVMRAAGK
ncbi:DUF4132 domain-containing protein [Brevibacillus sp. 179-C9.3 HS]|uniref:DUF4132 domain-containing protein n=1 Tax=unclassified Brevibacillus TaxID=2684853 RepID=UPI00399EF9A0